MTDSCSRASPDSGQNISMGCGVSTGSLGSSLSASSTAPATVDTPDLAASMDLELHRRPSTRSTKCCGVGGARYDDADNWRTAHRPLPPAAAAASLRAASNAATGGRLGLRRNDPADSSDPEPRAPLVSPVSGKKPCSCTTFGDSTGCAVTHRMSEALPASCNTRSYDLTARVWVMMSWRDRGE